MMLLVISLIFFGTLLIGVPVAMGMGLAGSTWILIFEGMEPALLVRRFYHALESFPLLSIPLYIMLGVLADRAKMLPELVVWLQMIFGRLRGGMAYINSVAAMLFSGISGTAVSDIASLGRPLIQLMTRAGYPLTYSSALTAATAIIGPVIPPSVGMIIYALAVGNILQLRAQASDSRLAPLTRELADHAVADSVAEIQHIDLPQLAVTQEPARAAKQLAFALGGPGPHQHVWQQPSPE